MFAPRAPGDIDIHRHGIAPARCVLRATGVVMSSTTKVFSPVMFSPCD
jgi:hypothetical protein